MTTVINNPGNGDGSDSSAVLLLAIVLILVAVVFFFIYGLPAIRNNEEAPQNNVQIDLKLPQEKTQNPPSPSGY